MVDSRTIETRSGAELEFSEMGFGGGPPGNMFCALSDAESDALIASAWDKGIRYFDTAPLYGMGLSEERMGRALASHPREAFLLSTKVGRLIRPSSEAEQERPDRPGLKIVYDYSYDGVMRSFEESLTRLGLDRVDIILVHDIDIFTHGSAEAAGARLVELMETGGWRALDELRGGGAVAAIGAGVNEWQPCARLLELADPDLFLLAGRYTLLEQEPLDSFFPQCLAQGVPVIAAGPYNSGVLAKRSGQFNYGPAPQEVIDKAERLRALCESFGVALADAAIRFLQAQPAIVSILSGHQSPAELAANVAALDASIPDDLWRALKDEGLVSPEAPVPG